MSDSNEEWVLEAEEEAFIVCVAVNIYFDARHLITTELPPYPTKSAKRELLVERLDHLVNSAIRTEVIDDYIEFMGRDKAAFNIFRSGDPMKQLLFDSLWRQALVAELMADYQRKPQNVAAVDDDTLVLDLRGNPEPLLSSILEKAITKAAVAAASDVGEQLCKRLQCIKRKRKEEEEDENKENSPPCVACMGWNDRPGYERCSLCRPLSPRWDAPPPASYNTRHVQGQEQLSAAVRAAEAAGDAAATPPASKKVKEDDSPKLVIGDGNTSDDDDKHACIMCGATCRAYLCDEHTIYHVPTPSPKSFDSLEY
ncbi:MAG: hypothetical protein GY737_09230 [Desulfobacteraceae bacterium]|nr:hypothetical protein [Desulfobacteraceae bacterium]